MKRFLFMVLSVCVIAGCSFFLETPQVTVKNVNLVGLDTTGLELEFYLGVNNPNPFAVTLKGYSYDVQVMTLPVAKGGSRTPVRFESSSETEMRLPVRIQYSDLAEILKRRPDPDRIPYRLNAGLELDSSLGNFLVPVEKKDTFSIPEQYRPSHALKLISDMFDRVIQ